MKYLVTGVNGQLGYDVVRELRERYPYDDILGIDINDLDITDEEAVHEFINNYKPNVVFHNAAYTSVDKAEENYDLCYKVNALGPKYITEACKEVNAKVIYISTDYVFDGTKVGYYEVDDKPNPQSVYGSTKLEGEKFTKTYQKHFIVRISWVFGKNGHNFIKTMLKFAESRKVINVVNDQIGSPTYTYDLSKLLVDMSQTEKYGTYQATNDGECSWYEFAYEIFKQANVEMKVNPISTENYLKLVTQQAKRPMNSKMSKEKLVKNGFSKLPDWKNALIRYLYEIKEAN